MNHPYNIGELIALAIVSIFCLGLSWMIAVGTSKMADAIKHERELIVPKNVQPIKLVGPQEVA